MMANIPDLSFLSYGERLTPEQGYAGGTVAQSLAVTAGAGAGKTGVLVARFIALLHSGVQPEEIVAITFTRKAAAEMQERIQRELHLQINNFPQAASWISKLPQARISTIHGLAAHILRRFPVQAGIDPAFRMLEEHQSERMLRDSCRVTLAAWLERQPLSEGFLEHYSADHFLDGLYDLIKLLRNRGEDIAALIERAKEAPQIDAPPNFSMYAAELAKSRTQISANARKLAGLVDALSASLRIAADNPYEARAVQQASEDLAALVAEKTQVAGKVKNMLDSLTPAESLLHTICAWLDKLRYPDLLRHLELLQQTLQHFARSKENAGGLDYSDLEEKAVAVLHQPQVAAELRREWRYILVDEFQDVNYSQYSLIEQLCGERLAEALFICGDPKQSIYGFRGAVVSLFEEMKRAMGESIGDKPIGIELRDNFRTLAPLLSFVNLCCADFMPGYREMKANRQVVSETPRVELLLSPGAKVDELRRNEARLLAERLSRMVGCSEQLVQDGETRRAVRYGDIALLFRARKDIDLYETALREAGIPTLQQGGGSFYSKPEILALRKLLAVLVDPDDQLSLWQWLTTDFVGISPEKLALGLLRGTEVSFKEIQLDRQSKELWQHAMQQIERWRGWLSALPLPEAIARIVDNSWMPEIFATDPEGEQKEANIAKFLDIVCDLAKRECDSLDDLLKLFDQLQEYGREEERQMQAIDRAEIEAVRLLTVHAAKGLEFPVVVLPDLLRYSDPRSGKRLLYYGRRQGLVLPTNLARINEIKEQQRQENDAEALRILYVALTRARDYLLLPGPADGALRRHPRSWWCCLEGSITKALQEGLCSSGETMPSCTKVVATQNETVAAADTLSAAELDARLIEMPLHSAAAVSVAVTALLGYQRCPRLYYLQSRLRLTPPFSHRRGQDLETLLKEDREAQSEEHQQTADDALRFGSLLHKLCELLAAAPHTSSDTATLELLLKERAPAFGYADAQADELKQRCIPLLKKLLASPMFTQLRSGAAHYSELPFVYRLPGGILLRGIIDLLLVNEDGTLSIIDYKTNRVRSTQRRSLTEQYGLQMRIYAAAAEAYFAKPVHSASLYLFYAKQGEELLEVVNSEYAAAQLDLFAGRETQLYQEAALGEAERLAEAIIRGWQASHFPALPQGSKVCSSCGFAALCHPKRRIGSMYGRLRYLARRRRTKGSYCRA